MLFILITFLGSILIKLSKIKPYSFFLILYGLLIGFTGYNINNDKLNGSINFWTNLHPHTFLFYFIPPLIYSSSCEINYHIFKNLIPLILSFALIGVIITCSLTTFFMYGIDPDFNNYYSLLLGVIISATDPIAVITILSELHLSEKLSTLIEAESLINDGVTISLFYISLNFILNNPSNSVIIIDSLRLSFGGIILGSLITMVKITILKRISKDVVSEIIFSLTCCYTIYYIAEETIIKTSGILALVTSGLIMSSYGKTRVKPDIQIVVNDFWRTLSSLSNIIIFTLAGLITYTKINFDHISNINWLLLFGLYLFLNLIRFFWTGIFYPCLKNHLFHYSKVDYLIIALSGLRGEISLALALFVNLEENIPKHIKNLILFYTSGIVILTILLNSIMISIIISYFHQDKIELDKKTIKAINNHVKQEGINYLETLQERDFHMTLAHIEPIKEKIMSEIKDNKVIDIKEKNDTLLGRELYLNTLKKTIWNLFEENILHYDVVMRLIEIVDINLDHIEYPWGIYMNDYCQKEHIETIEICFLGNIWFLGGIKNKFIYHKIEYNYNLVMGYIISQKKAIYNVRELIDDQYILNKIKKESENSLILPDQYVSYLESQYKDILSKIETRQVSLLLIEKQKKYIKHLVTNGEISDKVSKFLIDKLDKNINYS